MRRYDIGLVFVLLLSLLGSCGTINRLTKQFEEYGVRYDQLEKRYDTVVNYINKGVEKWDMVKDMLAKFPEKLKEADTNKDGKLSTAELIALLTGGGTLTGGAAVVVRNAMSNAKKQVQYATIDSRIAALESRNSQ